MSAQPRVDSADRELRSVLCPAGNKLQQKQPVKKPLSDNAKGLTFTAKKTPLSPTILRRNGVSMNASYSSEASSSCESSPLSIASSSSGKRALRRNGSNSSSTLRRNLMEERDDCFSDGRRRCAWITPKSEYERIFSIALRSDRYFILNNEHRERKCRDEFICHTNVTLLSTMKSGEFLSMMTSTCSSLSLSLFCFIA
ncbi:hypothetical protein IGI04_027801 [Brassica rapa subsp. trilocularis]|uniref:Uncharacterized protein n=1 Tax=Brassica rapa subsp. trilocularis TaxID=1813537 RepID=A0ABQ7L029_BRACM|nr:hypothetical protein IGI04_027801 [Brassica rapa subsp. trilocularis]